MTQKQSILDLFSDETISVVAYKNKSLKKNLINYLDEVDSASIPDIGQALNISVPKATSIVNELIADGLIADYGKDELREGKEEVRVGRPASKYGLLGSTGYFIGVDVKSYYVNLGLLDLKKKVVAEKMKEPFVLSNTRESFDQLMSIIEAFIKKQTIKKGNILAMCINLSGRINSENGYSFSYFHFNEEPLSKVVEKTLGIKTFIENDSRAMAYGEFHYGIVGDEKNVLFVNLDYGIGLGILVDGKIYTGKSGFAGEFGHIPVFDNEIICHCGKKGCLETEASGQSLIRKFRERLEQGSTSSLSAKNITPDKIRLEDIIAATNQEDVLSIELIAEIGEKIGRGLSILTNIFNPELVVLGGLMAETGDYIRLPIRSALNKYSLSLVNKDTRLASSKLNERAGIVGGCLIARNKTLLIN